MSAPMSFSCRLLHFPPPPFPITTTTTYAAISPSSNLRHHRNHFPSLLSSSPPFKPLQNPQFLPKPQFSTTNNNNNSNNNNNGCGKGGGNGGDWGGFFNFGEDNDDDLFSIFNFFEKLSVKNRNLLLFLVSSASSYCCYSILGSLANAKTGLGRQGEEGEAIFEIKGGKRIELVPDFEKDEFVVEKGLWRWLSSSKKGKLEIEDVLKECKELLMSFMLPEGYPGSVTSDYMEYSLWRAVQGVAAQINGVLATQALLYAIGLGKGAIPTAAAINWVLKDGIGYMSKIFLSKYGRHFDVNPKGWRLCADLLENAAYGLEILTPAFPHLFVPIGAVAGAGRSASVLIQAATRSCFFAGFAAQRNFAEVIAKGEAQGMVSKFVGITLGISLASWIQSSTPLTLLSFGVVTWVHMFCNLKSYQSIQIRTLNPYRASLVFSEYLLSGLVPPVKEVNDEEPLLPAVPVLDVKLSNRRPTEILSSEAKDAAIHIERRLQLGSKLSEVVRTREDVLALSNLFKNEGYILTEHDGNYCVVLKESALPHDMLKSMFHVSYLYWLEKNAGIEPSSIADDCRPGGRLQISLEYVQSEFNHVKGDGEVAGWTVDGLIARPLPNRIRLGNEMESSPAAG